MLILVRIRTVRQARCRIPGYEKGWFEAEHVKYGIKNERPGASEGGGSNKHRGLASFSSLEIVKQADGATPESMIEVCKGQPIPSVEIQMVGTAKGGRANFPFLMLRFEDTYLADWDLDIELTRIKETLKFDYRKVAITYFRTYDGYEYENCGEFGWDISVLGGDQQPGGTWHYTFKKRGDVMLDDL